jgi:hypothetical protein
VPMQPTASISTLRQKLQDKIDSLRKGRKSQPEEASHRSTPLGDEEEDVTAVGAANDDGSVSSDDNDTLASRDEMLEARRKRRGEVRDNRRRKRKEERRQGKATTKTGGREKPAEGKTKPTDFTAKPGKVRNNLFSSCRRSTSQTVTECLNPLLDKSVGSHVITYSLYGGCSRIQCLLPNVIVTILLNWKIPHSTKSHIKPYSSLGASKRTKEQVGRNARGEEKGYRREGTLGQDVTTCRRR